MQTIYVDNFRNFFNTFLELKDINFFVGENSTGKTSLMSLIYLLRNNDFWWKDLQFFDKQTGINLGYPSDVSDTNRNNGYLYFGIADDRGSAFPEAVLVGVKPSSDDFVLKKLWMISTKFQLQIQVEENKAFYRIKKRSSKDSNIIFREWIKNRHNNFPIDRKTFSKVNIDSITTRSINSVIVQIAVRNRKSSKYVNPIGVFSIPGSASWIKPIRSEPQKFYYETRTEATSDNEYYASLIRSIFTSKNKKLIGKITEFGKKSGLWRGLEPITHGKGNVHTPFSLKLRMEALTADITNVGYGVSQVLPIIVQTAMSGRGGKIFEIQQPEIHLHPKAQSALGEYIANSAMEGNKYVIETHSDYLLDRFRYTYSLLNRNSKNNVFAQIVFFVNDKQNRIFPIQINKSGNYSSTPPRKYLEFFIKESIENLRFT